MLFFSVPLLSLLVACTPTYLEGTYCSYIKEGVLLAGDCYTFEKEGTFEINTWSDIMEGNRIGKGLIC